MDRIYKNKSEVEKVLQEALWLAWQAAGHPMGMGVLQDNPIATRDDVWKNATGRGDYAMATSREGDLHADYVFGRMLKLSLRYDDTRIVVPEQKPTRDYQSWCGEYRT